MSSSSQVRTKTKSKVLVDDVRESPVDRYELRTRRRVIWLVVLLILVLVAVGLVRRFTADRPVDEAAIEQHFKYGSIGSEPGGALLDAVGGLLPPYAIFKVLPDICPDLLGPGGYASLGFIFEQGRDLPIGVSRRYRLGFDQVGLNCAVCHTGTYRASAKDQPTVVPGMPAHGFDLQEFTRFLVECTTDGRFTADNVIGKVEAAGIELGFFNRLLFRLQVVPRVRELTLQLGQRIGRLLGPEVTAWGRGRVDTFNPYKALQFNWRLRDLPSHELIGAADFPSLWNQQPRAGMDLHWDGNNNSVDERNLSASLGAGVTPVTIDHARLKRVADWAWTLPPPAYPWPGDIDRVQAREGERIYGEYCADCHAFDGERVGKVEPIQAIGTDPYRLNGYTFTFAANQYTLYPDSQYSFTHFRKTNGYANQPLDGVWARAPYLHNGSVPTLRDLLEPPPARPTGFYRGYDVYDRERVGFLSSVAAVNGQRFTWYDTREPGNDNGGHTGPAYGTELPATAKDAIVEFMKTL